MWWIFLGVIAGWFVVAALAGWWIGSAVHHADFEEHVGDDYVGTPVGDPERVA